MEMHIRKGSEASRVCIYITIYCIGSKRLIYEADFLVGL